MRWQSSRCFCTPDSIPTILTFFKAELQGLWDFSHSLCDSFTLSRDARLTRHVTLFVFFDLPAPILRRAQQCQVSIFSPYRPISPPKEMTGASENKRMEP